MDLPPTTIIIIVGTYIYTWNPKRCECRFVVIIMMVIMDTEEPAKHFVALNTTFVEKTNFYMLMIIHL